MQHSGSGTFGGGGYGGGGNRYGSSGSGGQAFQQSGGGGGGGASWGPRTSQQHPQHTGPQGGGGGWGRGGGGNRRGGGGMRNGGEYHQRNQQQQQQQHGGGGRGGGGGGSGNGGGGGGGGAVPIDAYFGGTGYTPAPLMHGPRGGSAAPTNVTSVSPGPAGASPATSMDIMGDRTASFGGGGGGAGGGGGGGMGGMGSRLASETDTVGAAATCPTKSHLAVGGFTGYHRVPAEPQSVSPPGGILRNLDRAALVAETQRQLSEPWAEFAPHPADESRASVRVAHARPAAGHIPQRPKG